MPLRASPHLWVRLDGEGALWRQLYRAMKHAIVSGELGAGKRVPSTRALAEGFGLSRSTALPVYDQLLAEGYLVSRRGSGTFVSDNVPRSDNRNALSRSREAALPPRLSLYGHRLAAPNLAYPFGDMERLEPARYEFVYGVPEVSAFPGHVLRRIAAVRLDQVATRSLSYSAPEGIRGLREMIADYLVRNRGARCTADQVLITTGAQQALSLISHTLLNCGDAVLLENPHHLGARNAFLAAGADIVPVPVDDEGVNLSAVSPGVLNRCVLAYVTPSHQFPTGVVLSLRRRMDLLSWASRRAAYIVEDDYDSEFRYAGRPLESLQALDQRGRVIYVGTFSKVLFPGLRIGYLVAPVELQSAFRSAKWIADWCTPTLEQATIADFMRDGHFERHLRSLRKRYAPRHAALREALQFHFGDAVSIGESNTGLHMVAWFDDVAPLALEAIVKQARAKDVGVHSVTPYYMGKPERSGLLLGFTLVNETDIREAIRRLATAFAGRRTPRKRRNAHVDGSP